jgi:hypothetical protein
MLRDIHSKIQWHEPCAFGKRQLLQGRSDHVRWIVVCQQQISVSTKEIFGNLTPAFLIQNFPFLLIVLQLDINLVTFPILLAISQIFYLDSISFLLRWQKSLWECLLKPRLPINKLPQCRLRLMLENGSSLCFLYLLMKQLHTWDQSIFLRMQLNGISRYDSINTSIDCRIWITIPLAGNSIEGCQWSIHIRSS